MRTFRTTALTLALICPMAFSSGTATADEPVDEALSWLVNEPVTLMDLGMMRLREDLREASKTLIDLGYTTREPRVGTYFDWREKKITAYVSMREPYSRPDERTCLEVYDRVMRYISAKSPGGNGSVGWYLESLFSHEGMGNNSRPMRMQEGLLGAIDFEVSILPPDPMRDSRKVQCRGRMDAERSDVSVTAS